MRNMKRSILLALALIGASVLFLGAAPGTASAGNCTFFGFNDNGHPGHVWYDGAWTWNPYITGCTGINGIQFQTYDQAGAGAPPFLYDATHLAYHFPYYGGGLCLSGTTLSNCSTVFHNVPWGSGCGAPAFYVQAWYTYRIRSLPGTWGPWHNLSGGSQLIC